MINCLLIDDEPLALKLLEDFLEKIPFMNLIARYEEPLKALPVIESGSVDLLFLDILMPDISGIDFYRSLKRKPEVIYTTAYSEYALKGFELNALSYLLKPISFEKFLQACNRANEFIERKKNKPMAAKDYFFINASHKLFKIFYSDILYLEGYKDYTKIHLKNNNTPMLVLYNLKHFETIFDEKDFVRVHRSFIIPVRMLNSVSRKSVTIGNKIIPVSDNYRENLFSVISEISA
ncbi:MAG: response regulator transcription factor [Bacteroidetes bacterium]|nr:response regulator transcription factor [Bacteroidota bacterium]MBS1930874.1 response regulator transcription factor [Bacteroidota bacterium]